MSLNTQFGEDTAGVSSIRRDMERLIAFARQAEYLADVLWNDPSFRAKTAALQAELDALEHVQVRVIDSEHADREIALAIKVSGSALRRKVNELIAEALGPFGLAQESAYHDGSAADAAPAAIEAPGAAPILAFRDTAAAVPAGTSPRTSGTKEDSSEGDARLRASIDLFTAAEYDVPKRAALLAENRDNWNRIAAMGWLGLGIPEEAGGHGGSLAAMMLVAERLGRGLAVEPFAGNIVYSSQVLLALLDAPAAAKLLAPAVAGKTRLAMACHEAPARGGLRWTSASATPDKGGHVLNGSKVAVAGGGAATHYLVSARTAGDVYDPFGHSLFLVPRDAPGLKVSAWRMIDGSDMATVVLNGVRVADDALLGKPGAALGALSAGMDATIVASAFGIVGAMDAMLAETAGQLREPFGSMLAVLELARSAAMLGLASLLQPDARRRAYATSATKAVVARASSLVCGQALRLHGDMGVTEKMRLGQLSSFAAASNSLRGSVDFHLSRMAMFM